jgi:hypothetical protein
MALGFAPLLLVRNLFDTFRRQSSQTLDQLFTYFEQQWLVAISAKMWNVYGVGIRTNNDCEGWHRRLNAIMSSRHHPNIWACISILRDEQAATDVIRQQIGAGHNVHRRNRAFEQAQSRIQRLCDRYNAGTISLLDYVTGVSHNLASY